MACGDKKFPAFEYQRGPNTKPIAIPAELSIEEYNKARKPFSYEGIPPLAFCIDFSGMMFSLRWTT